MKSSFAEIVLPMEDSPGGDLTTEGSSGRTGLGFFNPEAGLGLFAVATTDFFIAFAGLLFPCMLGFAATSGPAGFTDSTGLTDFTDSTDLTGLIGCVIKKFLPYLSKKIKTTENTELHG
jgi:hypothetical protein